VQGAGGAAAQRRTLIRTGRPHVWPALAALAVAFAASEASGQLVASHLAQGASRVIVPGLLSLTVLHNRGVAFGLLPRLPSPVTIAVALTVLAVVLYNGGAWLTTGVGQWGLGLVAGGALDNIWERVRSGYVLDYLDLHVWPVFNAADTAIVVGAGLLLVLALCAGGPHELRAARTPPDRRPADPGG